MIHANALPMIIVPMTFLFVLLIILIAKAPKVGAWIVGGLILLVPFALFRLAITGGFRDDEGVMVPLVVVSVTFLFVLLIILLAKAPKAGAGLIIALVVMGVLGALWAFTSPRVAPGGRVNHMRPVLPQIQQARPGTGRIAIDQGGKQVLIDQEGVTVKEPPASGRSPQPLAAPVAPAPIWSPGMDSELDADVYPSALAAARAAGPKVGRSIRELAGDVNEPSHVVVFQEVHPYRLVAELRDAIRQALPEASCDIEAQSRTLRQDEVGITIYLADVETRPASWGRSGEVAVRRGDSLIQYQPGEPAETIVGSGQLDINLSGRSGKVHIPIRYTEKPWMEDFATFASTRPEQAFIIARSLGTCTSESEANQQALDDARARLTEAIGNRSERKLGPDVPPITATDVLQGGFIVDRFAQSFQGSVGKIWRQALLLDVSGPKLAKLAAQKTVEFRHERATWARMGFSGIGVVLLIGTIYFFLNMATRGYYEWALRIASVVLAIVAVISILMIVQ